MKRRGAWSHVRFFSSLAIAIALVQSCSEDQSARENEPEMAQTPAATGDVVARADFVLCPAIEEIADDLAAVVGFERDRERQVAGIGAECFVRGTRAGWVGVAIPPAVVRSIAMQAGGYDGEATPAPALGADAVFVAGQTQPHVIFELLGQVIDVGVEHADYGAPERATVVKVAGMVRDALLRANGR